MSGFQRDPKVDELAKEHPIEYWGPVELRQIVDQRVLDQIARRACQRFFLLILRGETLEISITELAKAIGHHDPDGEARRLQREFDGYPYDPQSPYDDTDT